jgi:apolipoprotein D and lipocalin family protein
MLNISVKVFCLMLITSFLNGCATNSMNDIKPVKHVDINRFMGDWYVIAAIPTLIEKSSFNAIENYALNQDGTIATTFTYYKGGFDGPLKSYHPKGFIEPNTGNAIWGMQFIWPIKADYRIAYLDNDYQVTVIARNARDYVWIMARKPNISDSQYTQLVSFIKELGYDTNQLRKVPQSWPGLVKQ